MPKSSPTGNAQRQRGELSDQTEKTDFALGLLPLVLALVVVTFIAYQPVWNAGFVWDDQQNVTENHLLQTLDGLHKTWVDPNASIQYYPLTYTGFWIEHQLWGLQPAGYHVVNVALHVLNAFLLGILLTRLSVPGAWLAAFIFAVHPVHVESVAWITELKNVLSGVFFLSSFITYLRFVDHPARRWWFYGLALMLFLCALLSKTATMALPFAILLVLWWKQERVRWRDVLPLIPFFLATGAMATLTNWVEKYRGGALGADWQLSWVERCLIAGRVVWFYAGKLLWPHPLIFIYPRWQIDPSIWWQYLYPLAALAVILTLWFLRKRLGKGPFVAVFFFAGALVPVPAFFNLYFMRFSYVTDHFQYLPSIGLIALASGLAATALRSQKTLIKVAAPVVIGLIALSWQHARAFHDNESIWRDTLAKNPTSWMAHNNLGKLQREAGDLPHAVQEYELALRFKPDYAEAHYNMGNAYLQVGKVQEATAEYDRALQSNPNYVEVHNNLAFILMQSGDVQGAIGHLEQAARINPDSTEAHFNLALAVVKQGRIDEAISHLQIALKLNPGYSDARYILSMLLAKQNRIDEAIALMQDGLLREPKSERFQRALDGLRRAKSAPKKD